MTTMTSNEVRLPEEDRGATPISCSGYNKTNPCGQKFYHKDMVTIRDQNIVAIRKHKILFVKPIKLLH